MSETCWFCKKNPADTTNSIEVPIFKVLHVESKIIYPQKITTYNYTTGKVPIPRCSECAKVHAKVPKYWKRCLGIVGLVAFITILFLVIAAAKELLVSFALLLPFVPALLIVIILPIFTPIRIKHYLRSVGTLPESDKYKHPEVNRLFKLGWETGKKPGQEEH